MPKSGAEIFADARARVPQLTPDELKARRARGDDFVLLDVRDQNEVNLGRIPGAMHISRGTLEGKVEGAVPREKDIVVYCASGNRSAMAALTMQEMGYERVASLSGGFKDWAASGGDVED